MNKLTKSELIQRIRDIIDDPKRIVAQPFIDGHQVMHLIRNTEVLPDPVPEVDTELEEAKKLVGTWVKMKDDEDLDNSFAFEVKEVYRDKDDQEIKVFHERLGSFFLKETTPATLPTAAKWRCMKTDMPEYETVLTNLDGRYYPGWYLPGHKCWSVNRILVDLSRYDTALWLEIPRGE